VVEPQLVAAADEAKAEAEDRIAGLGRAGDGVDVELDEVLAGVGEHADPVEAVARLGARLVLQQALEDEVSEFLGRERYQRADGAAVYRNGYEPRMVKTTGGAIELERPRIRSVSGLDFESQVLGKGVARTHALEALIILGFLKGLPALRKRWLRIGCPRSGADVSRPPRSGRPMAPAGSYCKRNLGERSGMEWVIIAIVVIVLVVAGVVIARQRRSQQLQEGFGPEYGRTLAEKGDRRAAEAELLERRDRRRQLDIRELDRESRERYAERWQGVQRTFVDKPAVAVADADRLVSEVMRDRGYPVEEEFERRVADVSVDHPTVVENYRAAHGISVRAARNEADTEDLRQALVHFRALFEDLLGSDGGSGDTDEAKEMHR
jgi:hypothetical protein